MEEAVEVDSTAVEAEIPEEDAAVTRTTATAIRERRNFTLQ